MSNNILYIIVTYKEKYYQCSSYISLIKSFSSTKVLNKQLNVFVADNTDIKNWNCEINTNMGDNLRVYYNKYNNPGLSYAYNAGVEFAKKNGFSWIVLLDQDTTLPMNFYDDYNNAIIKENNVFLKVPITLIGHNKILSPSKYIGYRSYLYDKIEKGFKKLKGHSFINTGMLINIDFYIKVGGYNEEIKLDFTDHDFVYRCNKFAERFEVLDIKLNQDFSSLTNTKEQAIKRYYLYLRDLKSFRKGKKNKIALFFNSDFLRLLKLSIQYKSLDFIKIRLIK
ncbi:glycosyltransferase [Chryseobacterium rhizosphaerae]|uniref:glycosyltransferase n=1 Tax=Chryseobacterium rhizosphaerae TaxID=395937 RepID=UPI002359FF10|nr:glycosyltransferase [Chryseobacterium rhizosphaerae]MDC8098922.1 glycosyltransferase [Chryseobacterium rhizosphaerae]